MVKSQGLKVLMLSAECAPFVKVGGLGDVLGSLPPALKKLGVDVRVVLPLYGSISRKKYGLKKIYSNLEVPSGADFVKINIWQSVIPGSRVKVYFIEADKYFGKDDIYAKHNNEARFLFYSLAALYILPLIKFDPDIVHCHDSYTALAPAIINTDIFDFLNKIKTVYTIHNFGYQGRADELEDRVLRIGNLNVNSLDTLARDAENGDINFTVQGILNADIISTVSKTYAKEILTKEPAAGLERIIRKREKDLYGIVNGIDVDFFNPAKDKLIFKNYSLKNLSRKVLNKKALQKQLGLEVDEDKPLVGVISRLAEQKGLNLITAKLVRESDCQFVILGTGQPEIENNLKILAERYPKKFSAQITFDVKLAQRIYAASDIFLMPSQYEPCGLGQMIAMRYGAVPVVRATGGLADTVNRLTGFKFKEFTTEALDKALNEALNTYYGNPKKWLKIKKNGLKKDFSWKKSAKDYLLLYERALKKK